MRSNRPAAGLAGALALGFLASCSAEPATETGPEPAAAAATETFRYQGLCEASAAARLDDRHFAVASDDSEHIAIYERGKADAVGGMDHAEVTDLEGAVRIADTIFWLTSHSLNKDGEDKKKRKVLFATSIGPGPSLVAAGTDYRELRSKLAAIFNVDEKKVEARPDGSERITGFAADLNIEGLAATADGALLIGLRKPLGSDRKVYVIRIEQPLRLLGLAGGEAGAAPQASPPIALDLGGLGIRSIEHVGAGDRAYLIVAGPAGEGKEPPALYWWDGVSDKVTTGPKVDLTDMAPEALLAWSENDIQILGDNEPNCSEKKDSPPRWFPSVDLRVRPAAP